MRGKEQKKEVKEECERKKTEKGEEREEVGGNCRRFLD